MLIVSHDRTFLNEVITDVVYFTNKKRLESYRGDYSSFVHVREEKYKNDRRAYESQQMYRQHLQDFITTFKTEKKNAAQDRKVGQAMSKQKVLDKMEMLENPDEESTDRFSLRFPEPGLLRLPLIADIKNVNFKYPRRVIAAPDEANPTEEEKKAAGSAAAAPAQSPITLPDNGQLLLENITVRVEITSRIGILGANGSGKVSAQKNNKKLLTCHPLWLFARFSVFFFFWTFSVFSFFFFFFFSSFFRSWRLQRGCTCNR